MQKTIRNIFIFILVFCSIFLTACNFSSDKFYTSSKDEIKGVIYGKIDIDVAEAKITIEGSDHFGYSILYPEERKVDYYLENGTFYIKETNKDKKVKRDPIDIKFYIDSSVGLKNLNIDCLSGLISFDGLVVENTDFRLVNTDLEIKNSTIKEPIKFVSVSSDVEISNSSLTGIDFYSVAGKVNIQGKIQGGYVFETVSSDISISTGEESSLYNASYSSLTGSLDFFGEKYTSKEDTVKAGDENAINRIRFNSVSGDLKIY